MTGSSHTARKAHLLLLFLSSGLLTGVAAAPACRLRDLIPDLPAQARAADIAEAISSSSGLPVLLAPQLQATILDWPHKEITGKAAALALAHALGAEVRRVDVSPPGQSDVDSLVITHPRLFGDWPSHTRVYGVRPEKQEEAIERLQELFEARPSIAGYVQPAPDGAILVSWSSYFGDLSGPASVVIRPFLTPSALKEAESDWQGIGERTRTLWRRRHRIDLDDDGCFSDRSGTPLTNVPREPADLKEWRRRRWEAIDGEWSESTDWDELGGGWVPGEDF